MNIKITFGCIVLAMMIDISITETLPEQKRELDFHCPDTIRRMMREGCRHLQQILKNRAMENRKKKEEEAAAANSRNKRYSGNSIESVNATEIEFENDDDGFTVQFLENETHENFMKGHRLYNVRRSSYPDGAHLILSHRSAKMLRDYDSKYKIEPRSYHYRSVDGKLVKDHTNRHRRYTKSKHEFIERLAACCQYDTRCSVAFCLASP